MKIKSLYLAGAAAIVLLASSCSSSKEITYFQDLKPGQESVIATLSPIKLQPNDKISIIVSTGDSRLNSLFNLPVARANIGQGSTNGKITTGGSEGVAPLYNRPTRRYQFPCLREVACRRHDTGRTWRIYPSRTYKQRSR